MNLAIIHVLLKSYIKPFEQTLLNEYHGTDDRFEAVRNNASDEGNTEIVEILDYIELNNLKATFFQ